MSLDPVGAVTAVATADVRRHRHVHHRYRHKRPQHTLAATTDQDTLHPVQVLIEKEVCLLITVTGIKVCSTDGKAEGLNSIVGNAFRMAYAAQLELERRSVTNSPKINLNNTSWNKSANKLNVQRIQNTSPLAKRLAESPKPIPPKTLPGIRPFENSKDLDITSSQVSTPTSSDDSPDINTYKRMIEKPHLIKRLAMGLSVHTNCSNEDWYPLVCSSSVSSSPSTNSDDCNSPDTSQEKLKNNRVTQSNAGAPVSLSCIKLNHNMITNVIDKTPTPPPLPERSDSLLDKPDECELKKAPWFQAGIPREITLEVLSQEPVGAFMVRESTSKPGCFALSLRVPKEFHPLGIAHYLILRTNKGFKIKGFTKEFTTLTSLITHHSVMPELLPCPLSLSRYNPTFVKSDSNQDFADIDDDPDYNTLADFRKMMANLNV
ncbi:EGFR adapter protein-like isoform X5 [Daktulosphaira vitifoliae]|uniref:EGFR adapter protein-like isoform X5 n=1 Tax=Daktulosphaira vitifoliae TaxID=58002 RepID=UPI0021AA9911|nr:EGFR adapter protein-like isoform X5 [Daktulosphaira vitifoliae]